MIWGDLTVILYTYTSEVREHESRDGGEKHLLATSSRSLAGRASRSGSIGPLPTNRKRSPPNVRPTAGRRTLEVGLDIGGFTGDFENDVASQEERYNDLPCSVKRSPNHRGRHACWDDLQVGYMGNRSYI